MLIDGTSDDNDTATLSSNGDLAALTIAGIENVNVTVTNTAAAAAQDVAATNFSGVDNLTITKADKSVGGSTIAGNKDIVVTDVDATKVAAVTAGAGSKAVSVTQATKTGATINADTATGVVSVLGSGTVNAAEATTVNAGGIGTAAQDANAITVNAAKATTVNVGSNTDGGTAFDNTAITGAITINAEAATVVKAAVSGGATINAKGGTTGVVLTGIDDSGASVTTSYAGTKTAKGVIDLGGSAGTSDAATVSAAGIVTLTTNTGSQIETVNLSGNGAAATYEVVGAATTYNISGDQDVQLSGNESSFDGKTVANSGTGSTSIKITTLDDSDLSKAAVDNIIVSSNVASKTLTLADAATVTLATDIGTAFSVAGKAADYSVNLATADDTNASGATIEIATGTLTASTNLKTVNLDATVGKFTATTTTLAATGTLNVTGTKDVALGTTTAKTVDASTSTGKISLTTANAGTIKTGSDVDTITVDDTNSTTKVFAVEAGDGNDTINIIDAKEASSFDGGAGNDTIKIGGAGSAGGLAVGAAYVIVGGEGDDTVTVLADVDTDSIIAGGDGSDKVTFLDTDGVDLSDNSNFSLASVETIDISALTSGEVKMSLAQFNNNNTFKLSGNAVADVLAIVNTGTAGATIDASNVTHDSTQASTLRIEGLAAKQDTIMGSAKNDTITATTGGDVVDGGEGTDTYVGANLRANNVEGTSTGNSNGAVINLGSTAVTNTAVLAKTGSYTADSVTSVAGGQIAYTFAASASTNSAVTSSITNVENVSGTAGNDYIVGNDVANTITGGDGVDYLVGGLGNDVFVQTFTDVDTTAGAVTDVIADWTAGDTIKTGTAGAVATYAEAGAAVADLATLLTAAGTALDGTVKIYVGQVTGGDAYAVLDDNGTGYTSVIQLVGVALADIAAADFVA